MRAERKRDGAVVRWQIAQWGESREVEKSKVAI
jgi:hypothetical protein